MQRKLFAVSAVILGCLLFLIGRIAYINASMGNRYAKQVLSQENYDSRTLYSKRGEILDANGRVLAYSERQYHVVLDCAAVNTHEDLDNYQEYIDAVTETLKDVFDLDESDIRDRITGEKTRNSQYQVILKNITEDQKDAYDAYTDLSKERELPAKERRKLEKLSGAIWFEETYVRNYPMNSVGSTVIGFSNRIGDGVCGLEAYYDDMLKGTDGRVYGYLNENQEYQRRMINPQNGYTLQTTIDVNVQQILEKYIAQFDEIYGYDHNNGTAKHGAKNLGIVAMDPNSGAILGMATNSGYDLNDPQNLSAWYTRTEQLAMTNTQKVEALNTMWKNFCVSDGYEPGSVVKPITVASALECGAVTEDVGFYCDGGEFITDTYIKCDNIYGHGGETLADALKNSCNDALMEIGRRIGVARFVEYQSLFNFGKRTGIDLPNEASGVVYSRKGMNEVELATCAFGQGFTCSMIQEIAAFSSVVNGGYYYQPHVVSKVMNAEGKVVKNQDNLLLKQTISSDVSEKVKGYLEYAVQQGTGQKAQVEGYRIGGKTGTAEKINPETGTRWKDHYLVSFIGAAPIYDPDVVIYVVVDEPNVDDQAHSTYAQEIFRKTALELLPYLKIYPTENVTDALLAQLGLNKEEAPEEEAARLTFSAFDSYGNYYNNAYVNDAGLVVSSDGNLIDGAYVREDGTVVDAYMNEVAKISSQEEELDDAFDPKEDNPDMAVPPAENDADDSGGSIWDATIDPAEVAAAGSAP